MPIYFFIITRLFFAFANKRYAGKKLKYFKYGLIAKLIGALGFAIYHQYIYRGGDTLLYFDTGIKLANTASEDFGRFFTTLVSDPLANTNLQFETMDDVVFGEANFLVVKFTAVLAFISFKAYIPILFMFCSLSYIGIWYAYSSVCRMYEHLTKECAYAFLFIPSVILWGSGLGKDSLTLGGTCLIFGALLRLFLISKQKKLANIFYFAIGFFVVVIIKPYIIYSFILSFAIGIIFQKIVLIKSKTLKYIMAPLLVITGIGVAIGIFSYISSDSSFSLDLIADKVVANNKNLGQNSGAGSAYDLGMSVESINGFADVLPIFPKSIFVTLFRPFLWEISNPAMLLSALEGFVFFILMIYILIKRKLFGIIPGFIRHPLAISCLIYTLIFAGLVGISSGNFGTLVRYKIPCLPFFGLLLVLINDKKPKIEKSADMRPYTTQPL